MRGVFYATSAIIVGILVGNVLRLPSPELLGGLLCGIALSAVPLFADAVVPSFLYDIALLKVGVQAGERFTRQTIGSLGRLLPLLVVVMVLLIVGCGLLALLLWNVTGESLLDCYLATSPGGLPVILATVGDTSGNATFVSAAQILRILVILAALPFAAAAVARRRRPPP
ncbi:AbrB family transcriptional regulator [Actinophytocola sp.]|uniref:AbrB family transcriptional regulator n=1 Tax=Actinophytocola sp. TaxID=1872138 RepID=UPI003D6A207E